MDKDLTREELFLLVWERPTQEIAREMGISDVALAKGCKKLQIEIFKRAVDELAATGVDLGKMECTHSGVRFLESELAAKFLILIQHRFAKWLQDRAGSNDVGHASICSVQAGTDKLTICNFKSGR